MHYFQERPRDFFGGSEIHQGRAWKGVAAWGVPGEEPPGRRRSFQKICKKSMKKLAIFLKFPRKFRDFFKNFWNFIAFLAKIWTTI